MGKDEEIVKYGPFCSTSFSCQSVTFSSSAVRAIRGSSERRRKTKVPPLSKAELLPVVETELFVLFLHRPFKQFVNKQAALDRAVEHRNPAG